MKQTFVYGNYSYEYYVEYVERKTFGLEIQPNLRIIAKLPIGTSQHEIEKFLIRKWRWLDKNLNTLRKYQKTHSQKQYVSGESFYYLGRQYLLLVKLSDTETVKLQHGKLNVYTAKGLRNGNHTAYLLERWFAKHRTIIFHQEYKRALERFDYNNTPLLQERVMARRWGSYTADNTVHLNPRLIQAPREAIHYVCVHELCHVANKKHDAEFYSELQKRIPNWQKIKNSLEVKFG